MGADGYKRELKIWAQRMVLESEVAVRHSGEWDEEEKEERAQAKRGYSSWRRGTGESHLITAPWSNGDPPSQSELQAHGRGS